MGSSISRAILDLRPRLSVLCEHIMVTKMQATGTPGPQSRLVGGSEEFMAGGFLALGRGGCWTLTTLPKLFPSIQDTVCKQSLCTSLDRTQAQPRGGDYSWRTGFQPQVSRPVLIPPPVSSFLPTSPLPLNPPPGRDKMGTSSVLELWRLRALPARP